MAQPATTALNDLPQLLDDEEEQQPTQALIPYVTHLKGTNKHCVKYISFDDLNRQKIAFRYFYELLTPEIGKFRFVFDFDHFSEDDHSDIETLKQTLIDLATKFNLTIGYSGYTKDKAMKDKYKLTYYYKTAKYLSLHVCICNVYLTVATYKQLLDKKVNSFYTGHSLGPIDDIDSSIYSFINGEQKMRIPFSHKEDSKNNFTHVDTAAIVYNIVTGEKMKHSDCIFSCDGTERELTLADLTKMGFYCASDETIDRSINCLQAMLKTTSPAPTVDETTLSAANKQELSTVRFILKYVYDDGPKPKNHQYAARIAGILISAAADRFEQDVLNSVLYDWYNHDKDGNVIEHKNPDKMRGFVEKYYNQPKEQYQGAPPEIYAYALIKEAKKEQRKFLRKMVKETYASVTVRDQSDYHTLATIKHHTEEEVCNCKTADAATTLLCECVRYNPIKGLFYVYIPQSYAITEMKSEDFKLRYLPSLVDSKFSDKIYKALLRLTALRGVPILRLTDIHRCNPLDHCEDKSPSTKQADINNFHLFFNHVFKDQTQEVKDYLLKWIAVMVQSPGAIEAAIVLLYGKHGTGKSLLCKLIAFLLYTQHTVNFNNKAEQAIISPYTNYNDTLENHTARFNGKVAYRIFSGIQELDDKEENRALVVAGLKRLTDSMKDVERKGVDSTDMQNICQIMIGTNSHKPLPIELTERRYLAIEVNSEHRNDKKFWAQHYKNFSAPYFIKHLYDHFHDDIDISDLSSTDIPVTKMIVRMKMDSLTTLHRFVCKNYNDCVKGMNYADFLTVLNKDRRLLGKYGSEANLWRDYITQYQCSKYANGKYIPSDSSLEEIEDIVDLFQEMYDEGELDNSVDLDVDYNKGELSAEEQRKVQLQEVITSITKVCDTRKGKYQYIITPSIPKDNRAEIIDMLTQQGWTASSTLPDEKGRNCRKGYKKVCDKAE